MAGIACGCGVDLVEERVEVFRRQLPVGIFSQNVGLVQQFAELLAFLVFLFVCVDVDAYVLVVRKVTAESGDGGALVLYEGLYVGLVQHAESFPGHSIAETVGQGVGRSRSVTVIDGHVGGRNPVFARPGSPVEVRRRR